MYIVIVTCVYGTFLYVRHRPDPTRRQKNLLPSLLSPSTDQIYHPWPVMGNPRPVPGGCRWVEVMSVLLLC